MSRSVVTPPAAAARVAVSKPSHSGAARLVHVDVRVDDAGHHEPVAGVDHVARSTRRPSAPTRTIRPPSM